MGESGSPCGHETLEERVARLETFVTALAGASAVVRRPDQEALVNAR
jgi:hypothetical protein